MSGGVCNLQHTGLANRVGGLGGAPIRQVSTFFMFSVAQHVGHPLTT